VQIHDLGKHQRHQHVAVQRLDDRVGDHDLPEIPAPAPLEVGYDGDRQRGHGGTDVGHQHREADDRRQQCGVVEVEQHERDPGDTADDENLEHLAAHVIRDLAFGFAPDPVDQRTFARQPRGDPANHQVLVLEQEEYEHRDQHEINHQADQRAQGGQRPAERFLTQSGHLLAELLDQVLDLGRGHQLRIRFGELA